ncbi:protein SCAR2-like isoform X1 [Primulina tabacum]|uniref:protein SCAR2-like isoform X1 n=3 Tax=Primulina tabacum TaxID=48773 RepID=UPI003F5A9F74
MPITRYEIRSEYSLADPHLYTAVDKDDPEALLEGVAMSGFVGLLRQLGDLSEFAAVIFHELHDKVMVTATRGHTLLSRVQKLEDEFPSIQKAFLSQTDHSSLMYHAGVDCHPNLQMDHNIVTKGNLPRFIMESYEECRGPPRLFLLDKFDTAGAGACLERYTDPSFFKTETSSIKMNGTGIQREKKISKAKRKGTYWRNGVSPEVLPSSHAKLHQLFMEDHDGNSESSSADRVKLKRRLNVLPFDLKTGQSYIEKILKIPSPEHKVLHEITMNSSSLRTLPTTDHDDSSFGVLQFGMSADRDTVERKRSPPSPQREDIILKPSIYEQDEVSKCKISKEDNSYPSIVEDSVTYSCDRVTSEKDMVVDGESKADDILIGYLTDDFASEIDNFVDAPITIESELDTDSELREKTDIASYIDRQLSTFDVIATEEQHFHSTDSQSTGNSMLSDNENHSSGKEISSFSALYFPNTLADSTKYEDYVAACTPEIEIVNAPFFHKTADEVCPVAHHTRSAVSDDTCTGALAITNHCPDFMQQTSDRNLTDLDSTLEDSDSEYILGEIISRAPELVEKLNISDKEVKTNPVTDAAYSPSFSDFILQSEHSTLLSSSGVHLVRKSIDGNATYTNLCHTTDSPIAVSFDFVQVDSPDPGDLSEPECNEKLSLANSEAKKEKLAIDPGCSFSVSDSKTQLRDNSPSSSAVSNTVQRSNSENESCNSTGFLLYNRTCLPPNKDNLPQMISTETLVVDESNDGDLEFSENYRFDFPNSAHDGHSFMSALPKEEKSIDESNNVTLNAFANASNDFSSIMEASLGEELKKPSLGNAQTVDIEGNGCNRSVRNQICSPNIMASHVKCSQDWPETGLDTHDNYVVNLDEETTVNETLAVETLKSCEVLGLKATGITDDAPSHDLMALESLCSIQENFVGPHGKTDIVEKGGITSCRSSYAQEATNIPASPELTPLNDNNVSLSEPDSQSDVSGIAIVASSVVSVADNVGQNGVYSPLGINQLVEDGIPCFEDSNPNKLENGKNFLLESQGKSGLVEEVSQRHVTQSDLDTVFCISYNHPKSEEADTIVNLDFGSIVNEHSMDFVHTATTQSSSEQINLDPEQKLCLQRNLLYHDVCFHNIIETTPQEQASVLPTQLSQEFMDSGGMDLGSSCDQHMLELDDHQAVSNSASNCSLVSCPDQPSTPELPAPSNYEVDVSKHSNYPLGSMFPPGNCFLEVNSLNLGEFPPLPPLPPIQWRLGKVQHASSTIQGENQQEEFSQGTSTPSASTYDISSFHGELNGCLVQFSQDTISNKEKVGHNPLIQEIVDISSNTENEKLEVTISSSKIFALTYVEDVPQISPDIGSSKKEVEQSSTNLESNVLTRETIDHKQKIENVKQELVVPSSAIEFASPDAEGGNAIESRTRKLPLQRNPLIDTFTALDKSKLRKVTPRVKAEIQKEEERDSLLEQIRTKSFNLKPALATKPSIRGPRTNLKVAAILEKANAIRQAQAGSDEDIEDSWSDS